MSKQYGDYTKNLSIDWKDVQKKLTANDIAVEFAAVQVEDTTAYCAYLLKSTYDTPKMKVVLKSTSTLNKSNVYSTSTRELALIKDKYAIKSSAVYGGLNFDADTATVARESRKYGGKRDFSLYTPLTAESIDIRGAQDLPQELPATFDEAVDIDKQLRAVHIIDSLYTDSQGTESCFKALSGQKKNLLHIATHGFYWTENETKKAKDYAFLTLLNADGRTGKKYEKDKALTRSGLLFAGANNALMSL